MRGRDKDREGQCMCLEGCEQEVAGMQVPLALSVLSAPLSGAFNLLVFCRVTLTKFFFFVANIRSRASSYKSVLSAALAMAP